jgi:hypothetical protein
VKLFWKIYAWFSGAISLASMIYLPFGNFSRYYSIERKIIEEIILILFILVIFAFAYRKRIFKDYVWKAFILVLIADDIYGTVDQFNTLPHDFTLLLTLIITCVFWIINIIAVYLYAFNFFPKAKSIATSSN